MIASFFANAIQVDFASVLAMEHSGMCFVRAPSQSRPRGVYQAPPTKGVEQQISAHLHEEESECGSTGESSKQTEDIASGTQCGQSQMTKPVEKEVETQAVQKRKKKEKVISMVKKSVVGMQKPVEARSQAAPAKSKSGSSSDTDSCLLAKLKKGGAAPKRKLINPADKGKGVLSHFDRPNPVEEHYLLVIQDERDKAESQLHVFDQWRWFRIGHRLSKIPSMKFV
ncbi:hypothetical protein F511_13597 [Dorcoceras hygrometricum]|uniref:Uncharacterized protein n=1 Tax=Dorcoceras hygrometricum TaxID=472368 RepID=A0A2Z7B3L4_9LAMI|nr:hypothetical protein F511_13597 [Dorcoceras hygrometricum]